MAMVAVAIYFTLRKTPSAALFLSSAPLVALGMLLAGGLPKVGGLERILVMGFCGLLLWYCRRIWRIARVYPQLPEESTPPPPKGPSL